MSKLSSPISYTSNLRKQPLAIVCDWLTGYGGAEQVVQALHEMFPDAPIYTSQYDKQRTAWWLKDADVRTGWLQKLPTALKKFLPVFRALYFSRLSLDSYETVFVVNFGAESKAIKHQNQICYCNAPTHYYWSRYDEYMRTPGFPKGFNWLARLGLRALVGPMRTWDFRAAQRPRIMIANSTHIRNEIKKYYKRESIVIHPPVAAVDAQQKDSTTPTSQPPSPRSGYVVVGRQTPYKRIDLAVAACTKLNLPLTVYGNGPEHEHLKQLAGPSITFVPNASNEEIRRGLSSAKAFLFCGLDDFGVVAVEALSAGTPVVAYKAGGALDTIQEDINGIFFNQQTVDNVCVALQSFETKHFDAESVRDTSLSFSVSIFKSKIAKTLNYT